MRSLIVGDLHFNHTPQGLLEAQKKTTIRILEEGKSKGCDKVVFLGDLMMHRRPRPSVLLALKEVVDWCSDNFVSTYILRGNHDSENRNDDGVTALSLLKAPNVNIITHTFEDSTLPYTFIPHYEDEKVITQCLGEASPGNIVFGHFGYVGCLNSTGDADFGIPIASFKNLSILGHIHKHGGEGNVSVLGTPYSTNFGEAGKDCWYAVIEEENLSVDYYPIDFGVRHLVVNYKDIEDNLDWINDPQYFTMLRIKVHSVYDADEGMADLVDKLDVAGVEVKYVPFTDERDEFMPEVGKVSLEVTDDLIDSYINNTPTKINKELLLEGLKLIHEDQENRSK